MSRPVRILWIPLDTSAVCTPQTLGAAGALTINGTLASKSDAEKRHVTFENLERTVSLTSAGNLSGLQFTITGTLQGAVVSQTRSGPNANTVYTTQKFTTITSVTVNGAVATNVSVGNGDTGNTVWYLSDFYRSRSSLLVSVGLIAGTVSYDFQTTPNYPIEDLTKPFVPPFIWTDAIDGITIPTIPAATPMSNATESIMANYTFPTTASRIVVNSSDANTELDITFLAQGVL